MEVFSEHKADLFRFERLYPAPDWAKPPAVKPAKKKRRRDSEVVASEEEEESTSGDDMDADSDYISAQPLAKLLKDADTLTRGANTRPNKRRKLQPEVLDIQRMKDISGTQPVCNYLLIIPLIDHY